MSREHNKRVATEYFDAFIRGDRHWWQRNVRPDFRRHDPGLPYEVVGIDGLQHHHEVLLAGVPDLNLPIHDVGSGARTGASSSATPRPVAI